MLDQYTRNWKEDVLEPFARSFAPIHPNLMTLFSLSLGLVGAFFAWQGEYWIAAVFWALNRITDGLDGTMARVNQKQSDLGGYLDIMADFVVYALIPVALVLGRPSTTYFVWLAVLLAVYYVNTASWMYLAAILEKRAHGAAVRGEKTTVTMPGGLIGGTETAFVYVLFILLPGYLPWLFGGFAGLVLVTVVQRLIWATQELK